MIILCGFSGWSLICRQSQLPLSEKQWGRSKAWLWCAAVVSAPVSSRHTVCWATCISVWVVLCFCRSRWAVLWLADGLRSLPPSHPLQCGQAILYCHQLTLIRIVLYQSCRRVKMPVKVHAAHVHFMLECPALWVWECVCVCWGCASVRVSTGGDKERAEAHSGNLHSFHFAAEVIHLSELNCYQFMIALLQPVLYPHSNTQA